MSGTEQPDQVAPVDPEREKSPRRGMCAAVLTLEAIAVALSVPVMITISDVSPALALSLGLGLAVLCVLVAGILRRESGYRVGHALQVGAVALGFLAPMMFVVGGLFALLWGTAYGLGRKIERERAEAFAEYDRRRESGE
ncbi:hypothetical protein BJ993_003510 [Nocardioides aromaticivorans]|uniref:DUF4233 domain-containing protein n=1 Tax=Nocardioides aromaticivorans TaxID=200618 RepID=A0A7Y9ZK74_9ACTN|nr:DUF4233 domain-containing protein [Nocardioides aromaticivorans]NYI46430.1 hypothetical protein [Nocardioides aromaticivorans]